MVDPGPRFENLVASHLLKLVHYQVDVEGRDLELRYFRDIGVNRKVVDRPYSASADLSSIFVGSAISINDASSVGGFGRNLDVVRIKNEGL